MVKGKTSVKKKSWYQIVAPRMFDNAVIGETTVEEQTKLIGKPILVNMMVLTNDPRKQNTNLKFVIDKVEENKALTSIIGYNLSSSYLRRLMRRATTRIDDSFIVETADNVKLRIKPFLMTRQYVTGSVSTNLRKASRNYIAKQIAKTPYEKLIYAIVTTKFQKSVSGFLRKTYPLRGCEIKSLKVEKKKTEDSAKPTVKVEAKKPEQPKEKVESNKKETTEKKTVEKEKIEKSEKKAEKTKEEKK